MTDQQTVADPATRTPTKAATVQKLLARSKGATLPELTNATSWQPHTARAFLTGLRKKGANMSGNAAPMAIPAGASSDRMPPTDEQLAGLATMSPARLRAEWRRLHRGQTLTAGLTSSQLIRSIAWRLQEKMLGGLPAPRARELDRLADQLDRNGELEMASNQSLKAGSQLVRHWHGSVYTVTVLDQGFEFERRQYSSLTQIARQITSAAWSGPRFFGLRNRRDQ